MATTPDAAVYRFAGLKKLAACKGLAFASTQAPLNAGTAPVLEAQSAGGLDLTASIADATAAAEGLHISMSQATVARTGGVLAALKLDTTSLAGDSGGDYANIELSATDGGGSAVHSGIYAADALDAFLKASASGKGGLTSSADGMTADPETDTEDGYLTVAIAGTSYQIPIYAA